LECNEEKRREDMQNIGMIDLTTSQVLKLKVVSDIIQPNEGGHDMFEMMLGKRKRSVDENKNSSLEPYPIACVVGTWR